MIKLYISKPYKLGLRICVSIFTTQLYELIRPENSFKMMKNFLLIILSFCAFNTFTHAQESEYDSIISITKNELINTDPEKALKNIQYLYKISKNDAERLRSLNLKGGFLLYFGIKNEALNAFLASEKLAIREKDYDALTRVYGYIASIHRESDLISSSREYLKRAEESSQKIKDKSIQTRYKGNIEHEIASIEVDRENYDLSLKHIRNSIKHFKSEYINENVGVFHHLYNSYGMMSDVYLRLNKLDSSLYYLEVAKEYSDKVYSDENRLRSNYFNSLAKIYLAKNESKKAEENFLFAQEIAEKSRNFKLLKEIYSTLNSFYKDNNLETKAYEYADLYQGLIAQNQESNDKVADILLKVIYKELRESKNESYVKSLTINILIVISIILLSLLGWYIYQKRKREKKFQLYINNLNANVHQKAKLVPENSKESSYISKETEQYILDELNKLEKTKFYLDKNISLSILSGLVGVNQRYLTYVIKKHKHTDFTSYVNELRINYIVNCMKEDPKYLKYKISYLAEICGFSSHSRFTINFKKVTGITPSVFITYIKKENLKDKESSEAS